jgi:hypothetical protein
MNIQRSVRVNLFWGAFKFQMATTLPKAPKTEMHAEVKNDNEKPVPSYLKMYKDDPKMLELLRSRM